MACLNMNQNMENCVYNVIKNLKKFLKMNHCINPIFDLYSFYQNHKHESHFKKMFVQESGKISEVLIN